jgi:cytochrome c biogenesis protein CcdA
MELTSIPVVLALWLGILTSVSPCPLAANIAAVSFIVKGGGNTFSACASGIAYTLGRAVAYVALGSLISASLLNLPAGAYFLQTTMPKVLGPVLIVTGMLLLGVFSFSMPGLTVSQERGEKLRRAGIPGALAMGIIFALAFCPVSAAFFFGSLIPLSLQQNSSIGLPLIYGIGTGLPVFGFALVVMFGVKQLGRLFHAVAKVECWVRRVTAVVMLLVGMHLSLLYIFNVDIFA